MFRNLRNFPGLGAEESEIDEGVEVADLFVPFLLALKMFLICSLRIG
jgi:hypothetical protein